jgi:exonuclease III
MAAIDDQVIRETLEDEFSRNFALLPAQETRGGAALAVHEDAYIILQAFTLEFSVTAELQSTTSLDKWWLTVVYGPQGDSEKLRFLQEVRQIKFLVSGAWLLLGDFNLILSAEDKSNSNLNRRLMGTFKSVVDDLELKELTLKGRKFTWSNDVTQTRIDKGFCTAEWDLMLLNCVLQAVSSLVSDHCPLLLVKHATVAGTGGYGLRCFGLDCRAFRSLFKQNGQNRHRCSIHTSTYTSNCSGSGRS